MHHKRNAILALALLIPAPSIGTWMGMVAAEGTPLGEWAFLASKVWVFVLPLAWLMLVDRKRPTIPRPVARGMAAACLTGTAIVLAIGGAYLLFGRSWIDADVMGEKAHDVGLTSPLIYLGGAAYWITINSLLEEYVWRWFVVTRCEVLMPRWAAVAASGFFFTGSGRCHGTVTTPISLAPAAILIDRLNSVEPFQEAFGPKSTSPSVSTAPSITPSQVMPSPDWIRFAATRPRLVILIRPHVWRSMTGMYVLTMTSSILIAFLQPGQLVLMARIDTVNLYPHR